MPLSEPLVQLRAFSLSSAQLSGKGISPQRLPAQTHSPLHIDAWSSSPHFPVFKEYCLADLSQYRDGRVGLRWRTEAEVKAGKGQFSCGNKRCASHEQLRSYEVNFAYSDTAYVV